MIGGNVFICRVNGQRPDMTIIFYFLFCHKEKKLEVGRKRSSVDEDILSTRKFEAKLPRHLRESHLCDPKELLTTGELSECWGKPGLDQVLAGDD